MGFTPGVTKFDKGRLRLFINWLDSIDYLDGSLIVIFSDHGEGKVSSGSNFFGHGADLFDNVLRIPLIIRHPDIQQKTVENIVSSVDIFTTILELCKIKKEHETDGIFMGNGREFSYSETWSSLKNFYRIDKKADETYLYCPKTEWLLRQRCVRTPSFKFILCGQKEQWLDDFLNTSTRLFISKFYRYIPSFIKNFIIGPKKPVPSNGIFDLPNREFVIKLYRTVLSRFEDSQGLENYVKLLESGKKTKQEILLSFLVLLPISC